MSTFIHRVASAYLMATYGWRRAARGQWRHSLQLQKKPADSDWLQATLGAR